MVPDNKAFIGILLAEEEEWNMLKEEIQTLVSLLLPLLDEIHKVLVSQHCIFSLRKVPLISQFTMNHRVNCAYVNNTRFFLLICAGSISLGQAEVYLRNGNMKKTYSS